MHESPGTDVPGLILHQIRTRPGTAALHYGDKEFTYADLGRSADLLNRRLRERGVGKGDLIPLLMTGGPASPIGMLASMWLGAPFVPVHAGWPWERVRATLDRLRPRIVLTDQDPARWGGLHPDVIRVHAVPATEAGPPAAAVLLPPLSAPLPASPWTRPVEVGPQDLVYGFFTSGSTGVPKCALNLHAGLLNRFRVMTRRFGTGHVVLQNSPHVFDSSLWQLLWPLTTGGAVVQPEHDGLDLVRTVETIGRYGVTMTDFVPSVFGALVDILRDRPSLADRLTSLRYLLIGGEEINPKAVHEFRRLLPGVSVVNTYGPTEASIGFVFHEVTDADGDDIPLGMAIDGTVAVVMTDGGTIAGAGELGEICAGGTCLGAGYLGDQELTGKSFIPNPFPEVPGDRLYRTGDLGYYGADGLLRFAGRRDHQVKIGGVRIELVEVETALLAHPAVREVKVVAVGEEQARALVGFVVLDPAARDAAARDAAVPDAAALGGSARVSGDLTWLGDHVRTLLPAHSVPRRFVVLGRLPRTPNGKTDRAALSALARLPLPVPAGDHRSRVLSAEEVAVAGLWERLLGRSDFTADSDFFAEGGTSLLAYQLSLWLGAQFGTPVSPRDIAVAPTLGEQAELASGRRHRGGPLRRTAALIRADAGLPDDIRRGRSPAHGGVAGPGRPGTAPRNVLLTGATGFIGQHLLADLLRQTGATVHCLVRKGAAGTAEERLRALVGSGPVAAAVGGGDRPDDARRRVLVVEGDLGRPQLGLSADRFRHLAGGVDAVVHAGAEVNLVSGYRALRAANVAAVGELLRLAATGRPKRLVHLSTLGVLPPVAGTTIDELPEPGEDLPPDGYSQSKWAAERLLARARERGIPSTAVRLGEVMAHSTTGSADERSTLTTLLRACVSLRQRPFTHVVTDWTPVDVVSRVTVAALAAGALPDGAVHLVAPRAVHVDRLLDRLGALVPLETVGYREFHEAVARRAVVDPMMAQLLALLPHPQLGDGAAELESVFHDGTTLYRAANGGRLLSLFARGFTGADGTALDAFVAGLARPGEVAGSPDSGAAPSRVTPEGVATTAPGFR